MIDEVRIQQNFAKDISNLRALVNWAAEQQLFGSFAARRPDLGRMIKCGYCGTRRRQGSEKCCNPTYAKTQRAWDPEQGFHQVECEERVHNSPISKSVIKRLQHSVAGRHGQSKPWKIRQLAFRLYKDPAFLKAAVAEMQCGAPVVDTEGKRVGFAVPTPEHIPAFAEKLFLTMAEKRDRILRNIQKSSRRRNRWQS